MSAASARHAFAWVAQNAWPECKPEDHRPADLATGSVTNLQASPRAATPKAASCRHCVRRPSRETWANWPAARPRSGPA
eukprot:CAMPEP_0183392268 /NCGR_PEP_ID=MMETSP0370-20130417/7020_1 /TAXON_ID=268820 /ORGANISM="Peridinium aciculiferum, Strain PAER-2" /LENGTH=78 /DNA_ID=CAMNT_0025572157 /DNA_START=32 /DNA_END=265 /DNA_ORIENTATION=-